MSGANKVQERIATTRDSRTHSFKFSHSRLTIDRTQTVRQTQFLGPRLCTSIAQLFAVLNRWRKSAELVRSYAPRLDLARER